MKEFYLQKTVSRKAVSTFIWGTSSLLWSNYVQVKHTDGKFCLTVDLIFWKRKISFKMTDDNGPSSSAAQAAFQSLRLEGTWERFQEGTFQARKRTYLESLSETFRKGTDGKPACYLTGANSACRERMIYTRWSSKKESGIFIGNLIIYHSRDVRNPFCTCAIPIPT